MATGRRSSANRVDRAVLDLAEAVVLPGREGEVFDAVVADEDERGVRSSSSPSRRCWPRLRAHRVDPGDAVRVRLVRADPASRSVEFTRVG